MNDKAQSGGSVNGWVNRELSDQDEAHMLRELLELKSRGGIGGVPNFVEAKSTWNKETTTSAPGVQVVSERTHILVEVEKPIQIYAEVTMGPEMLAERKRWEQHLRNVRVHEAELREARVRVHLAEQAAKSWKSPLRFISIVLDKKHRDALELSLADTRDELKDKVIAGTLTRDQAKRRFQWRAAVEVAHVVGPFVVWFVDAALKVIKLTETLKQRTPPNP